MDTAQLQTFRTAIEKKLEDYDPVKDKIDEKAKFDTVEQITLSEIYNKQASGCDKCLLWSGVIGSLVFGCTMPAGCAVWGILMDELGGHMAGSMKDTAFLMLYLGGVTLTFAWL